MFILIKQVFIALLRWSGSLSSMINASCHTNCICSNNQPCTTRPTLMDLNAHEFNQKITIQWWLM